MSKKINDAIKNLADLTSIKQKFAESDENYEYQLLVCYGASCISSNCKSIHTELINRLEEYNLGDKVKIKLTGCIGTCAVGPTLTVEPEGVFYCNLQPENIERIIREHLVGKKVVEDLCYVDAVSGERIVHIKDINYFNAQEKVVMKNCGRIDYASLEEYIANDGYYALQNVLSSLKPEEVVEEVEKSGLRGRGGGGFPTGFKWKLAAKNQADQKYVICNADEGDPGAFMDRCLIEGDAYLVIEGMTIAGYAIGASKGIVYVRAEYPVAIERLQAAIEEARKRTLLGKGIFGSEFEFDIDIRIGAGAFVCGEETALMASIEGKRGEPRQKPPFPSDKGLYGKPSIINNVETFGNIATIFLKGSSWFNNIGTAKSKGTKVFALAGDVNNTGIVEVPMGTTLGEIIFDIGGGIPNGKKFKVAQTGGPSGGCLTAEHLNAPVDYDSLVELGAIMGSGGLICMDEDTCMVDVARYFMEFVQEESCGKCVACRIGTKRMLDILERITQGEGVEGDVEKLIELGDTIKDTALCGLGQTAPNPVLSTIKYFREEYDEHIRNKYCRAGVCGDLFISPCENACPAHVNVPGYIALIAEGRVEDAYKLIKQENPFPSVCGRVCTHPCEQSCRRAQLDDPIAIMDLKRFAADEMMKRDTPLSELIYPSNGKSVGIVGAGPSGLTCAYYLGKLGYDVTVYEAQSVVGGMLAVGIPEYRLPKNTLDKEIQTIRQTGVSILTNTEVGKDIEFDELAKRHDAVYAAAGTQISRRIGIKGEDMKGVYHGIDFLKDVNLGKLNKVEGKVAIIGGGNTAIDASRTALRLGADEVHILYRRTTDDMPADDREIRDAIEEGIKIHTLVAPLEFTGKNKVENIKCARMELKGFDRSGRKRPTIIEGSEFDFAVDMIIPAISQEVDLPFVGGGSQIKITNWGTVDVDADTMMTNREGVFAGGDNVRGADVVITAIADGKKAAGHIDRYLGGKGILNKGEKIEIPVAKDDEEIIEHERFEMKYLSPEERCGNCREVALGFHRLNAYAEAMRCLRCDKR